MSADLVDDMHYAEDMATEAIGLLRMVIDNQDSPVAGIHAAIERFLAVPYCRLSCSDHDHSDPDDEEAADCGCPSDHPPVEENSDSHLDL